MGYCWYCHWGWSVEVAAIYDRALAGSSESAMHFGPAHIVWEEENFGRDSVQWCLDHFDEYVKDLDPRDLPAVRRSLEELLALPDEVLDPEPQGFRDGEDATPPLDPADWPPAIETVRR